MRLNKKRLAALAMSAVMAASAVPFPVYAEELSAGDDVVVSAEVVAEPTTEETVVPEVGKDVTYPFKTAGVEINEQTGEVTKVELQFEDGSRKPITDATEIKKLVKVDFHKATCTEFAYAKVTVTYEGKSVDIDWKGTTYKASHDYTNDSYKWIQTKTPSCTVEGEETKYKVCDICKEPTEATSEKRAIPKKHADWNDKIETTLKVSVSEVKDGDVVLAVNTKLNDKKEVVLENPSIDGVYSVVYACPSCGAEAVKETITIKATQASAVTVVEATKGDYAYTNIKNIEQVKAAVAGDMKNLPLSENAVKSIELKDCTKPGTFFVKYTYKGEEFYGKYEVAAHHFGTYETVVVAKEDAKLLNVTTDAEGNLKVENTSCYKTVDYTVALHCTAADCECEEHKVDTSKFVEVDPSTHSTHGKLVSATAKEVKPTGAHLFSEKTKAVDNVIKNNEKVRFSQLHTAAAGDEYIKFVVPENVCENGGVVTVNYLCQRCNEIEKTQDVTVYPEAHVAGKKVVENEVKATCTTKGHKDLVTRCEYCNAEMSRVTVEEPKLAHTNATKTDEGAYITFVGDKVVDNNGRLLTLEAGDLLGGSEISITGGKTYRYVGTAKNGVASEFGVYPTIRTNCTECGNNEVILNEKVTNVNSVKVELVSVKKQDAKGQNGSVTMKATYTLVDGKNAGKEITKEVTFPYFSSMEAYTGRTEPEVKDGLHKDEDGVYRYYVNGELQKDFTGIIDYAGNKYLIAAGELAKDVNGLWYSEADKVWYFLVEGGVRTDYTGTALYDGEWFYVSNGRLNESVNGLVPYNGGTFLFVEGRLRNDVSGLWQDINNPEDWYFLALGQVQTGYTGVAMYDGGFFVVKEGKFDKDYNGTIKYDGETFKVVGGQLVIK